MNEPRDIDGEMLFVGDSVTVVLPGDPDNGLRYDVLDISLDKTIEINTGVIHPIPLWMAWGSYDVNECSPIGFPCHEVRKLKEPNVFKVNLESKKILIPA